VKGRECSGQLGPIHIAAAADEGGGILWWHFPQAHAYWGDSQPNIQGSYFIPQEARLLQNGEFGSQLLNVLARWLCQSWCWCAPCPLPAMGARVQQWKWGLTHQLTSSRIAFQGKGLTYGLCLVESPPVIANRTKPRESLLLATCLPMKYTSHKRKARTNSSTQNHHVTQSFSLLSRLAMRPIEVHPQHSFKNKHYNEC
jgi:hypothetical protein